MSQNDTCVKWKVRHITPPKEELQSIPLAFYNCDICGLQVKTQSNLRAHYIKTHGLINDVKDVAFLLRKKTDVSDIFHCPVSACKYTKLSGGGFSKFWHLKQHYQLVHMKKTLHCTSCGQGFSTPSAQAYHSKSCGTRFECPVCGRKYKAKKFLNQHSRRSGHDVQMRRPVLKSASSITQQPPSVNLLTEAITAATAEVKEQEENQAPSRMAILPLLILPLEVGTDQASVSVVTSAVSLASDVIAHLRANLSALSPLFCTSSTTPAADCSGSATQLKRLSNSPKADFSSSYKRPTILSGINGNGDRPLVDVGTATLRLSHAHTQTDVNVPPTCSLPVPSAAAVAVVAEQQTDLSHFYNHDSYTTSTTSTSHCHFASSRMSVGSSPPAFLSDLSHSSTFMSPGHSIELQYPEMNSSGTMTNYSSQSHYHPYHRTLGDSIVGTSRSSAEQVPFYNPYGSQQTGWFGAFSAAGTDALLYRGDWRGNTANSVAVETTLDLVNFDANNSGNCYWPPAESFAHMQTQTMLDADNLDQWINNVQTQTFSSSSTQSQQFGWSMPFTSDSVCVGINTEMLMTPEHQSSS